MKKYIIGLLTGLIIAGSIGVYAAIKIQADEIGYKGRTVADALNDLYASQSNNAKKICKLESGYTANAVGAKYECALGEDSNNQVIKDYFFILTIDNNKVKLIAEHNITEDAAESKMTWMKAMKYFASGAGSTVKSTWTNVIDVDLPMVQDLASAVGYTDWTYENKGKNDWFYFDKKNDAFTQTQVASASSLSAYGWLFNYTGACVSYGCDPDTSLSSEAAYGYWTRDIVAQNSNAFAWVVGRFGRTFNVAVTDATTYGVRPVITVLKSSLYE